jgi:hypothetical protein
VTAELSGKKTTIRDAGSQRALLGALLYGLKEEDDPSSFYVGQGESCLCGLFEIRIRPV